jgi:hypothetical protein
MSRWQLWVIAAAGLVFALVFGVRQSVALFIGPINSATGLGIAAISLAFAYGQLRLALVPRHHARDRRRAHTHADQGSDEAAPGIRSLIAALRCR